MLAVAVFARRASQRRASLPRWLRAAGAASRIFATLATGATPVATAPTNTPLAVFPFVLENVSAAGAGPLQGSAADLARMRAVTDAARQLLTDSGRYQLVEATSAPRASQENESACDERCSARRAHDLGAAQAMTGSVTREAKTEYYVAFQITDATSGQPIETQRAFFIGADDAWPSGVRLLLRHTLLEAQNRP